MHKQDVNSYLFHVFMGHGLTIEHESKGLKAQRLKTTHPKKNIQKH